ncbi:uncharacterized protein LOC144169275 [Haemaphysalis longicornis]
MALSMVLIGARPKARLGAQFPEPPILQGLGRGTVLGPTNAPQGTRRMSHPTGGVETFRPDDGTSYWPLRSSRALLSRGSTSYCSPKLPRTGTRPRCLRPVSPVQSPVHRHGGRVVLWSDSSLERPRLTGWFVPAARTCTPMGPWRPEELSSSAGAAWTKLWGHGLGGDSGTSAIAETTPAQVSPTTWVPKTNLKKKRLGKPLFLKKLSKKVLGSRRGNRKFTLMLAHQGLAYHLQSPKRPSPAMSAKAETG